MPRWPIADAGVIDTLETKVFGDSPSLLFAPAFLDIGIIVKGVEGTVRFIAQPAIAMFPFKVGLTSVGEVDKELLTWLKKAFDAAG